MEYTFFCHGCTYRLFTKRNVPSDALTQTQGAKCYDYRLETLLHDARSRDASCMNVVRRFINNEITSSSISKMNDRFVLKRLALLIHQREVFVVREAIIDVDKIKATTPQPATIQLKMGTPEYIKNIAGQYDKLYKYWQNNLEKLGYGEYYMPGIISNRIKYTFKNDNFHDCLEFSQAATDYLNSFHVSPDSRAIAVPTSTLDWVPLVGKWWGIDHYQVAIQVKGPDKNWVEVKRYDPWRWNWIHARFK